MPATYAHYVFGKKVLKKLPESIRQEVRQGEDAFLLGLHGPDLLFYYYPVSKNRINQQGVAMHRELAAELTGEGACGERSRIRHSGLICMDFCAILSWTASAIRLSISMWMRRGLGI